MLIRSQNKKELLNLDNAVSISVDDDNEIIIAYGFDHAWDRMGNYSTEEKAIKVLDMIQNEYGTHYYGNGGPMATANFYIPPFGYIPPKVFQMPQDAEV